MFLALIGFAAIMLPYIDYMWHPKPSLDRKTIPAFVAHTEYTGHVGTKLTKNTTMLAHPNGFALKAALTTW